MEQTPRLFLKTILIVILVSEICIECNLFSIAPSQTRYYSKNEIELEKKESSIPKTLLRTSAPITLKYNRIGAKGYANKWWNGFNLHYNNFSGSGGDCANFVSQCLIAGGLSLHNGTNGNGYGVYPDTDRPTSYSNGTIPYCDYLNLHLKNYQETSITYVTNSNASVPAEITGGDVVIFGDKLGDKYKHAMIIVWDGASEVGLAGHSSSVWNRTFTDELAYFSCATFYHIEDKSAGLYHFKITSGTLNVRVGAGLNGLGQNYQDIGDLHQGEEYIAFETEKDESGKIWWHFWFDDRAAWCASWYTTNITGNRIVEVEIANYLNVRNGPGTSYPIFGQVYDGMRFVSDRSDGSWYRYWYGGTQKYSSSGYFTMITTYNSNYSKPIMGFLPYWVSGNQNYSIITHLAWFSVELNADGTIGNVHGWPDWEVINAVHNEGNRVVLTATMFSSTDIHTLLTSYKTTAVNNLLAQVQAGNADGICIDFENPTQSGDNALLVQFMNSLYTTFKAARNDYHISLCTPSVDWWGTYNYASINNYVDAFMLMGYGYYYSGSANAGPTSPLEWAGYDLNWSVNDHLNKGVTKSKLILGLPFYGFDWPVSNTNKNAPTTGAGSSRTYSVVMNLIATYSPTVYYNSTAETAWFNYYSSGQRQVWFDNYTSLERKFDYIFDRDLGGLGIWAYGYQGAHIELEKLIYDKFWSNRSSLHPPGVFTLISNAENPDEDGKFYLNWSISSGALSYSVFVSNNPITTPGSGSLLFSDLTTNSTKISNLLSGTYYFAVVSENASGSTLSNNIQITVLLPIELYSDAGTPDRDGRFTLRWNNTLGYDNYSLYYSDYPIIEVNQTIPLVKEGLTNDSYIVSNVPDDTTIYYIIVAFDESGNVSSNYVMVQISFGLPGEFMLFSSAEDPDTNGNFILTWSDSDGASNYSVYYYYYPITKFNDSLIEIIKETNNLTQFLSEFTNGTYYFVVFAFNDYGNSSSNCLRIFVQIPPLAKEIDDDDNDNDKNKTKEIDSFLELLSNPIIIFVLGIGAGITITLTILIFKKPSYRASKKEREKLEKVSAHARTKTPIK